MNEIKDILTADFFNKYYIQSKMTYRQIYQALQTKGHKISLSSIKKYGQKLEISRNNSECKRGLDWSVSFLTNKMKTVIDGLVLGDAHISKIGEISASLQYKDFRDYCSCFLNVYKPSNLSFYQNNRSYFRFCTKMHPDFQKQRIRWYPKGEKIVPKDIKITPLSVLLWYLGDGYLNPRLGNIFLHTNSFTPAGVRLLVNILQEKGVKCKYLLVTKQGLYKKDYPLIYISSKVTPLFFDFIGSECPVISYDYKFNIPDWFPGATRITHISEMYNIPLSKVRYIVSKLENNNSSYVKRITPKGRIWILKNGIKKVVKLCS